MWDMMDHGRTEGWVAGIMKTLADLAPEVSWARGAHAIGKGVPGKSPFSFVASIYSFPQPLLRNETNRHYDVVSHQGWRNPLLHLVLPRVVNNVITLEGPSSPFSYRLAPERAIICGARGIARMGADYWADTYHAGWNGGVQVGMPVTALLWPGPNGAESSVRFECFREGLQEAEARIFLERMLEGPLRGTPEAEGIQEVLDARIRETLFVPPGSSAPRIAEYYGGWQKRSHTLYSATALAARLAGAKLAETQ